MHFEIKDIELEVIERVALEDNLSLDGALKKLLFLGRDIKRNEDVDPQIRTQALEKLQKRLEKISIVTEKFHSQVKTATSDIREML